MPNARVMHASSEALSTNSTYRFSASNFVRGLNSGVTPLGIEAAPCQFFCCLPPPPSLPCYCCMTLTEKILARGAGKARVQAGDNVWVKADVLMTHDVCGPGTIGVFKREFGKAAKVWDRERNVIIPDHYIFTADSKSNRNVDILREFVKEQDIPYFYDVIDDPDGKWVFDPTKGALKKQYVSHFAGVC